MINDFIQSEIEGILKQFQFFKNDSRGLAAETKNAHCLLSSLIAFQFLVVHIEMNTFAKLQALSPWQLFFPHL